MALFFYVEQVSSGFSYFKLEKYRCHTTQNVMVVYSFGFPLASAVTIANLPGIPGIKYSN